MVGVSLPIRSDEGFIPLDQMVNNVIAPLKATFGSQFGGVMGWEFALDQAGAWANGIGQALNTNNSMLDATFTVYPQAVIRSSYLGTGIHFAPFGKTLTTDQWNTVLTRVGFMTPSFARVMISADFYSSGLDGAENPVYRWDSSAMQQTYEMLDYCQANAIAGVRRAEPSRNVSLLSPTSASPPPLDQDDWGLSRLPKEHQRLHLRPLLQLRQ